MSQGFSLVEPNIFSCASAERLENRSPQRRPGSRTAFSLVELSIVLVILGLLTGGILTGQNLIRAAELRSLTADLESYQAAVLTFIDQYSHMPGDMSNATDFWGSKGGNGADNTCAAVESTDLSTCNGDGNGILWNAVYTAGFQQSENFLFWQHLSNAGLIGGSYTGALLDGTTVACSPNVNCPALKLSNSEIRAAQYKGAGWGFNNHDDYESFYVQSTNSSEQGTLAPEELWSIDTKFDDGRPGYGQILTVPSSAGWGGTNCLLDASGQGSASTARYNIADSSAKCTFYFRFE